MRSITVLSALTLCQTAYSQVTTSPKRGLVYVPNNNYPQDDSIWDSSSSDLTWYYNYGPSPSSAYKGNKNFQFVPMLWGAPSSNTDDTFESTVQGLISGGTNITHVLTFNEPDGQQSTGGSDVPSELAAETWIREVEPLKKLGVSLGAPAVTGANTGFQWLQNFFTACNGSCSADFIPIHWYGNFEGLASHIGQVRGTYPNMTIWITEYADPDTDLSDTQSFYNESSQYFDRIDYIERYSYFGSFRSSVSNVGPNVAMLDENGKLTDIGSWYLGGAATGNVPEATGAASRVQLAGFGLLSVFAAFWILL